MPDTAPHPIQHAILLSEDTVFLGLFEEALRETASTILISRAQPAGHLGALKRILDVGKGPDTRLVIDSAHYRKTKRQEFWTLVKTWIEGGGHCLIAGETSPKVTDLASLADLNASLLGYSPGWSATRLADALSASIEGKGFVGEEAYRGRLTSSGEAILTSSRQKTEFLDALSDALLGAEVQKTKRGRVVTLVDELLMNAIYDAPANSKTSRLFGNVGDRAEVELDPGKKVRVLWTLKPSEFRVTVTDTYGSLTPGPFTKKVATFLSQKQIQPDRSSESSAGAGVGIFMALRNVRTFSAFVQPDAFTEVSATLDVPPFTERARQKKEIFFYFASREGGGI